MSLDFLEMLRRLVADEAVERKMRNIPQLQVPSAEFVCPSYADIGVVFDDVQRRLASFPNVTVKLVQKGSQTRIRMEYAT